MNISHLIILLVRAFAICLAIYSMNTFIYNMLLYVDSGVISKLSVGFPASILLAGVLVWFLPYSFARVLTGNSDLNESSSDKVSFEQFSNTIFLTLALYLIFKVISDGGYWLYFYLNFESYAMEDIGIDAKASIFATVLEAFFVVILLLGRKKIFHLFKMLRS
jgi:hypothetical protein